MHISIEFKYTTEHLTVNVTFFAFNNNGYQHTDEKIQNNGKTQKSLRKMRKIEF